MNKSFFNKSGWPTRLLTITTIVGILFPGGAAWGVLPLFPPPTPAIPLSRIPVPSPSNLNQFVKNQTAAVNLGKALFWDMQVGSDGITACATCHFKAGADNRKKNTVNPGPNGVFDVRGPNQTLLPADFPFHQRQAPVDFQASPVLRDADDIVGSQGVLFTQFQDIVPGSAVELGTAIPDLVFQMNGVNMRRVTGRQAPPVINAVFNFANFWDGRANNIFNGENPFGPMDPNAGVWFNDTGTLVKRPVTIRNASLASQATGPPLSDVEMSFKGRTFPQIGRKMLSLVPLASQSIHPNDSVLGQLSKAVATPGAKGLNTNYRQMIQDAFQNNLWDSQQSVNLPTVAMPGGEPFSQLEANFSFFWGMAIQAYESTLVSDQTPFDRYLGGDNAALTDQQKLGFNIFFGAGLCYECHGGTTLTKASVENAEFLADAGNELIQFMFLGNSLPGIYDQGFYNISVRPTTENLGRGGTAPFINPRTGQDFPLSWSQLAELQAIGKMPFSTPQLPQLIPSSMRTDVDGAYKTPALRNIELTAPYFHNGGALTLDQVVEFYNRGGNFPMQNIANLHPAINQIDFLAFTTGNDAALVAFLKGLTDERVRNESAPFDHPELLIPEGDTTMINLPATGANGLLFGTVSINGGALVTGSQSATLTLTTSGTNPVTQMQFSKDGVNYFPFEPFAATRTVTLLPGDGTKTIYVRFKDSVGNVSQAFTDTIILDTTKPTGSLTINGGAILTNSLSANLTLAASDLNGVTSMQFSKDGVNYFAFEPFAATRIVTLLPGDGTKTIYVRYKDSVGNVSLPISNTITLDTTKPSGTISFVTPTPTTSATGTLALTASDANRIAQMQFSKDGVNFFPFELFAANRTVTLAPGLNTLSVRFKDNAGNISPIFSSSITRQ